MQRTGKTQSKETQPRSKRPRVLHKPRKPAGVQRVNGLNMTIPEKPTIEGQSHAHKSSLGKTNLQELRLQRAMDRMNSSDCSSSEGSAMQKLCSVETIWKDMKLHREKTDPCLCLTAFSRSVDNRAVGDHDELMKLTKTAKGLLESIREDRGNTSRTPSRSIHQRPALVKKRPFYSQSSNKDLLGLSQNHQNILTKPVRKRLRK